MEATVNAGAGNDTVTITSLDGVADLVDNKVTIDGGAGTDTLVMTEALAETLSALTAVEYAKKGITNFEKLTISTALDAAVNTERLGLTTDVTLKAGSTTGAALNNMVSGATVAFGGVHATQVLAVGIKGAADAGRNADVLNLVLSAEQTADTSYGTVTAASVETINIDSSTGNDALTSFTNTLQVTATSAETINISGDMKFSLAVNATLANNFVALDTIDASANTAGVTITLAGTSTIYANAVTITGTAKADTITGGDGKDAINAGAGNDTVNSSAGADVITLGAGTDTFVIGTAAHSSATSTAKITDFVGGVDAIKFVAAASFEIVSGATITNAADLAAATTAAFALAATVNNAGIEALQFTYDSKTFFAIEASATADATAAVVIDVTGLTGTVLAGDFIA